MKSLKISILVFVSMVAACFIGIGKVQAQEFTIQGDLVSSYVWRGFYQTGVSFQPTLGFGVGDFSLTARGSTDFDGAYSGEGAEAKEIHCRLKSFLCQSLGIQCLPELTKMTKAGRIILRMLSSTIRSVSSL